MPNACGSPPDGRAPSPELRSPPLSISRSCKSRNRRYVLRRFARFPGLAPFFSASTLQGIRLCEPCHICCVDHLVMIHVRACQISDDGPRASWATKMRRCHLHLLTRTRGSARNPIASRRTALALLSTVGLFATLATAKIPPARSSPQKKRRCRRYTGTRPAWILPFRLSPQRRRARFPMSCNRPGNAPES